MLLRAISCCLLLGILTFGSSAYGQTIKWSGHTWRVRNDTGGPGPNSFLPANVVVDADGALHLSITKIDGQWSCGEIFTTEALGYGTYEFDVESRVDQLDPNIVLGLFSYPIHGPDGTDEIDIEYSFWGHAGNDNLGFTVYPSTLKHKNVSKSFLVHPPIASSKNEYVWSKESIRFRCLTDPPKGDGETIAHWQTPASFSALLAQKPMPVHLNLWLFQAPAPSDQKPVEIVIKRFVFKPEK